MEKEDSSKEQLKKKIERKLNILSFLQAHRLSFQDISVQTNHVSNRKLKALGVKICFDY